MYKLTRFPMTPRLFLVFLPIMAFWVVGESQPKILNVRIAYGYKDARPARFVGDKYERLNLIQMLTSSCPSGESLACDFKQDAKDGDLFLKKVFTFKGGWVHVHLRVTESSVGPDDEENRKNPYQQYLSLKSKQNFAAGVEQGEATFYIGHSRDGGGPDFTPPKLDSKQHVDYDWYKRNQKGFFELLLAIEKRVQDKTRNPAPVLGLISCASHKLFYKQIQRKAKDIKLVTTDKLLYYTESQSLALSSLSKYISEATTDSDQRSWRPGGARFF